MKKQIRDALSEEAKGDAYGVTEQDEELLLTREKIAEALYLRYAISAIAPSSGVLLKWGIQGEKYKEQWRKGADQILAEAKPIIEKRERERIGTDLEDLIYSAELDMKVEDMAVIFGLVGVLKSGQALKKG